MNTNPITSYGIIKLNFGKVRLFYKNRLFSIPSIKIGYQVLTYHENIFTNHLHLSKQINAFSFHKVPLFCKIFKVRLFLTRDLKPNQIQS